MRHISFVKPAAFLVVPYRALGEPVEAHLPPRLNGLTVQVHLPLRNVGRVFRVNHEVNRNI